MSQKETLAGDKPKQLSEFDNWFELVQDELRENTDVFLPADEIARVDLVRKTARMAVESNTEESQGTKPPDYRAWVWSLLRRTHGIASVRESLSGYLERCRQILTSKVNRHHARTADQEGQMASDVASAVKRAELPAELRPVLELAQTLESLDGLLACLDDLPPRDQADQAQGPDIAAFVGAAISFGISIGCNATEMRFHRELKRDVAGQQGCSKGGVGTGIRSQNPKLWGELVYQVFGRRFADGEKWTSAIRFAGVAPSKSMSEAKHSKTPKPVLNSKKQVEIPDTKTIRKWVTEEVDQLLDEIEDGMRSNQWTEAEACHVIAQAHRYAGHLLNPKWLEKLMDERRDGTLPGRRWDLLGELVAGKLSPQSKKYLMEIMPEHQFSSNFMIDDALNAYDDGELPAE